MADLNRGARLAIAVGALAFVVVPPVAAMLGQPDLVTLATQVAIFALAAVSLDLLIGYAGLPSFGHAAFFGLGAYVVGIMAMQAGDGGYFLGFIPASRDAWVVWPVAVAVAAIAALIIGALSLRTSGVQFIMITLAFAEMLYYLFVSLQVYGGDNGLGFQQRNAVPFLGPRDDAGFYYLCLVILALFLLLCRRLVRSRFGVALQAIRQNEQRALALGLRTYGYKLVAFVIAGAGAGLAGVLDANLNRFVSPDLMHWTTSGDIMIMVVLGGTGSLYGPILGAAVMIVLQSYLARWTDHWMLFLGLFLVLVILFARRGIWGLLRRPTPAALAR